MKLTGRLGQTGPGRGAELTKLLASRLFVLESAVAGLEAEAPHEVFVRVRPSTGSGSDAVPFTRQLVQMYVGWGERRGMKVVELASSGDSVVLAVGGLGAGVILAAESGMQCSSPTPRALPSVPWNASPSPSRSCHAHLGRQQGAPGS